MFALQTKLFNNLRFINQSQIWIFILLSEEVEFNYFMLKEELYGPAAGGKAPHVAAWGLVI